jgi:tetratricopeptide (TPR) repeat protein
MRPPADKLRVFVSSTINECAAERARVRAAIISINHEPVLFEDVGARPHPPRAVYKPRIETSDVFIGIYRHEYGWIAPGMDISGVEDEFQIASRRGMDRLIYVFKGPGSRDKRLEALIDSAMNAGVTLAFYSDPSELYDRIRDDVTAVVSSRFVDQAIMMDKMADGEDLLTSLIPNPSHRFRRPEVEQDILDTLRIAGRLAVTGALGAGKTVLLAQMAIEHGWIFVDCHGLSRIDCLARAANALRSRCGQAPITFPTEQRAKLALLEAWESVSGETLVVDNPAEPELMWELLAGQNGLIVTARARMEVPVGLRVEIPPLNRDEVNAWVTTLRGHPPEPGELASLFRLSGGSPLYLRFYALGQRPEQELSLQDLEIRAFQSLPPRAREIVSYLVLAGQPLSLHDLYRLLGDTNHGPEIVAQLTSEANALLRHSKGRLELVHDHPRETLLRQLQSSPTRLAFFASRLGGYLEEQRNYVAAFHVYHSAGELRHVDLILDRAAHQAARQGGGAPAIPIFRRKSERAREHGSVDDEVHALLGLAHALQQTGARAEAASALDAARSVAGQSTDPAHTLQVQETELLLNLEGRSWTDRIEGFRALRLAYLDLGHDFDAARITTMLTAEYIHSQDLVLAEQEAKRALDYFQRIGDDYGIRTAQINLAAAISGQGNRSREAAELARELDQQLDPSEYPRERAVLCNLLTRHYRKLGETALAARYAIEAIEIGERISDRHVIAINRINLGNVRRDERLLAEALDEYRIADRVASEGGFRADEAAANELIASVLNEQGQYGLAVMHSRHAAGVAAQTGDLLILARAREEEAVALAAQRDIPAAVTAYTDAAIAASSVRPKGGFSVSLLENGLALCASAGRKDLMSGVLKRFFAVADGATEDASLDAILRIWYAALPRMAQKVDAERILPVVALAGATLLSGLPTLIERRIILQSIQALLSNDQPMPEVAGLIGTAALLMASSWDSMILDDLVSVADQLCDFSSGLYFKPYSDGAAHWTTRMEIGAGVTATIVQLDDSPRSAAMALIMAVLLRGTSEGLRSMVLEADDLPRSEVVVNIVCRRDFDANVGPDISKLGTLPHGFGVFESSDVTRPEQPPIILVHDDRFAGGWKPHLDRISGVQVAFAELLRVIVVHLIGKQIEREILFPKIGNFVRRLTYQGQAWAH